MLVNDALAVLARLCGPDAPQRGEAAADALGLLALVAGQDVEPAEGSDGADGRWRIARRVAPDRVISTVDRQARHTRKSRSQRRDGYRGHLMTEPDTGLITDCEMTMATGADNTDAAMGVTLADRDRFHPGTQEGEVANSRHVLPDPDGGWRVEKPGASRASAKADTQTEAIDRAREIVHNDGGGEILIHGRDGKIRAKDTVAPGNDPHPPRG